MSLSARARATLQVVASTFVPGAEALGLGERLAETIGRLPRAADRAELAQLLELLESRAVSLALAGTLTPFSRMAPSQRERYLRDWATSRLGVRRKAFQALKRLTTVLAYTATDANGRNPLWAEIGYPGPLGPAPVTAPRIHPLSISADTTLDCDVVIVGSGAGGSVVAAELAAAGRSVVVLEKGGYVSEAQFSQLEGDMLARLYDAGGLLTTADLGLLVLQGSCLGGGTVVNYTTSFRTPDGIREQWAREHHLPHFTGPEFSASLDAVTRRLNVNTDECRPSGRDQVLIRGLDALEWDHGFLPRDTRGCGQDDECGYCGYGCRRRAKQSTLVTYLEDAFEQGTRIVVGCDVRRVLLEGNYAVGVEGRVGSHRVTVRARATVVAGGSIHSPALLLRSGLELPALGRNLTLHPATAVFGLMAEQVRPWTGTLQAHYSDEFADLDAGYGFKIETAPLHPSLAALAMPWESAAGHRDLMRRLPHLTLLGILLRDRDGGRVTVDRDGAPVVHYRLSSYDAAHLRQGIAAAAELLEAAGAREIWAPQSRWVAYQPAQGANGTARSRWLGRADAAGYGPNELLLCTFHQMASCRMGNSAATSVVTPDNQVHGVGGLFVADASVFPSASGVNPMLTIMAIAHRAGRIIAAWL
jgi:choline dehydrogenase-like flavoprotein